MKLQPVFLKPESLQPGESRCIRMPVTTSLAGVEVSIWAHAIRGVDEGPTLALTGVLHGDEWLGAVFLKRLVSELDPTELRGTVLVVPVGNPLALDLGKRTAPDEAGGTDLNRAFPGGTALITDRFATIITREVLFYADALLDFHQGDWGVTWACVEYPVDLPDSKVISSAEAMADAFGFPCIHRAKIMSGLSGIGSACGYAGMKLGVPSLIVSIGGSGFGADAEAVWTQKAVLGIQNVMCHLGMLSGVAPPPPRRLVFEESWTLRSTVGGILEPTLDADRLLTEVAGDEILGKVTSPYTFEVLEELAAPKPGVLCSLARTHPIQPGTVVFSAADLTSPSTVWVEAGY